LKINIKESTKLPIHYLFPRFIRFFSLTMASLIMAYAIYMILFDIYADSSFFKKLFPFLIMFFTFDSIYKNLSTLHTVSFYDKYLQLSFLAKKNITIAWENIVRIDTNEINKRVVYIHYMQDGSKKTFPFVMSYPNFIDILNFIKIFAPQIETDDMVNSLIFIPKEYTDNNVQT